MAGFAILFPGLRELADTDLVEPRFAVCDHGADDAIGHGNPLLAVVRVGLGEIVVTALCGTDLLAHGRYVGAAIGIELRPVVKHHDDVGAGVDLYRRCRTRLEVIETNSLEVDLEAERLLGFGQHRLAQNLIAGRDEVVPLQPVYGRSLRVGGRFAGC